MQAGDGSRVRIAFLRRQFLIVMQEISERFSLRHTASAESLSSPAKRAR